MKTSLQQVLDQGNPNRFGSIINGSSPARARFPAPNHQHPGRPKLTRARATLCTALALTVAAAFPGRAATRVWTNINSSIWGAATNWNPNGVPGASDTAVITNDGDYTVTLNVSTNVSGLTLGYAGSSTSTQVLAVNANTLTSSGAATLNSHGQLNLGSGAAVFNGGGSLYDGSTFTGSGSAQLKSGTFTLYGNVNSSYSSSNVVLAGGVLTGTGVLDGLWTWTSGNIAAGSRLTIATGGVLVLSGVTINDYYLYGILTNAGTLRLVSGHLGCAGNNNEGQLINLLGALVDIAADAPIDVFGSSSAFILNRGVLRKSGGTGTNDISPPFYNYGTVEVASGGLAFKGGGTLNDGARFSGLGSAWLASGTFTNYGTVTSDSNAVLAGAWLDGTGVLDGLWTWTSGHLAGTSRLTIAANGALVLAGATTNADYNLYGALTNAGTLRLANGDLQCAASGSPGTSRPGDLVDMQGSANISFGWRLDHQPGETVEVHRRHERGPAILGSIWHGGCGKRRFEVHLRRELASRFGLHWSRQRLPDRLEHRIHALWDCEQHVERGAGAGRAGAEGHRGAGRIMDLDQREHCCREQAYHRH